MTGGTQTCSEIKTVCKGHTEKAYEAIEKQRWVVICATSLVQVWLSCIRRCTEVGNDAVLPFQVRSQTSKRLPWALSSMSQSKGAAPWGWEGFAWKEKRAITKANKNAVSESCKLAQAPSFSIPAAFEVLIYVSSPKQLRSAHGKTAKMFPLVALFNNLIYKVLWDGPVG